MNLLRRKLSSKNLDVEDNSHGAKGSTSAERHSAETKPSLFRRLSRKNSSNEEPPAGEPKTARPSSGEHVLTGAEKLVQPTVSEVQPDSTPHDAPPRVEASTLNYINSTSTHAAQVDPDAIGQAVTTMGETVAEAPTLAAPTDLDHHHAHGTKHTAGLSKIDVQGLFSGAPQFILEKGRRGRYFPQAFFPWNNDLEISDLQDRRYLRHESFSLATLHAHLPIPDEVGWKPGMTPPVPTTERLDTGKRPMFELGIFERPNMLSLEGREPGTVGMRYFLERPVADGLHDENIKEHGKDVDLDLALAHTPAIEAFKMLAIGRETEEKDVKIGKHAPPQDRVKLLQGGPHAWKAVGVRDLSMKTMLDRFEVIQQMRDYIVNAGWRTTVLDQITSAELHDHLFSEILFPPRKSGHDIKTDKTGLKVQIEALVKILTTPGAWLDLSIPEARLRFGKILHSQTTQYDSESDTFCVEPERKWLFVQLLLAVELVVRLDAALRLGVAQHSEKFDLDLNSEEIHHFNKLRNLKVDWDFVTARRFLSLSYIKGIARKGTADQGPNSPGPSNKTAEHRSGFIAKLFSHTDEDKGPAPDYTHDICDMAVLPRQPQAMVTGLIRFASALGWPRTSEIEDQLRRKLCPTDFEMREKFLIDEISCASKSKSTKKAQAVNITQPLGNFYVDLQAATSTTIGGWSSHSWLSGLILPGNSICDILISTLLENDTDPNTLATLGSHGTHPLRGSGFILNGSSWWSKSCIIGRVLAPIHGAKESMGWIFTPNMAPLVETTNEPLKDRWVKVKAFPVPTTRERPRILDGDKIAVESSPLGVGKGGIHGTEFSMVTDHILDDEKKPQLLVKDIKIYLSTSDATESNPEHPLAAWTQFAISVTYPQGWKTPTSEANIVTKHVRYGLDRAVYFITAHPCRLPHGHATFAPGSADADYEEHRLPPKHKSHEHIPAHPLHKTYNFVPKTLSDLIAEDPPEPPNPCAGHSSEIWVVDARSQVSQSQPDHSEAHYLSQFYSTSSASAEEHGAGPRTESAATAASHAQLWTRDIFVRSWCAEKGRNALIARVGRTCISCAIREAKALEIAIVVRVGVKE